MSAGTTDDDDTREEHRRGREEKSSNPVVRVALKIRGSFLTFVGAMGVLLILLAIVMDVFDLKRGVLSAMFLTWGVSAILYSLAGFVFLRWIDY